MADDLVDRLLAQTGLYVGRSLQVPDQLEQVARIMVTALPGRSGVTFDYEGLSQNQDYPRPHAEHAVLGRTSSGPALYTAHIHGGGAWGRSSVDGATRDRARLLRGGRRCVTVPV